jgi:glutamyl-tRNA synthetase
MVPKQATPADMAKALLALLEERLDPILEWKAEAIEAALREFAASSSWKPKEAFMAARVAVTGRAATPPLFETMELLGKEVCRRRLRSAAETLRRTPA